MTPEEFARELEKTPKNLMKARPGEILFEDDYPEGRMRIVCHAMNGDRDAIGRDIAAVAQVGTRHLVRALNNLTEIGHDGALLLAELLFDAIDGDDAARLHKFMQLLDAVSPRLRTGLGWLETRAAALLDGRTLDAQTRIDLWMHWCRAVLRSSPEATPLIEQIAPRRPGNLSRSQHRALMDAYHGENIPWDERSAACFLLLGNQLIALGDAQSFVEKGYAAFPLDAIEGVEILALAVENDATKFAESDAIHAKLSQLRNDNLFLRDMHADAFVAASESVFSRLDAIPPTALELALELQARDKNERLILSAFLDDARRRDWVIMARKFNATPALARIFFAHFDPDNAIVRAFSNDLVHALLEHHNADALRAEAWDMAVEAEDLDALRTEAKYWAEI